MGHDVIPIGQHRLDTSSIITIAQELADRFNATILYGYTDDRIGKNYQGSFKFIEQGRVKKVGSDSYILQDSLYMDRIYGPGKHDNEMCYELYSESDYDNYHISIYETAFQCDAHFESRWWSFCRCFTGIITDVEFLQYLNEYRKKIFNEIKRMGGELAIYGDDQGESAWLDYGGTMNWKDMLIRLQTEFGDDFINISTFFKTKQPFRKDCPLAFFDDFADLKE
jgi:hypothetical protein